MSEPILCEYLLKLATDAPTRDRFKKLSCADRENFLIVLGLDEGAASALASWDEYAIKEYVDKELNPKGVPVGKLHTIQMAVNLPDSLTHGK